MKFVKKSTLSWLPWHYLEPLVLLLKHRERLHPYTLSSVVDPLHFGCVSVTFWYGSASRFADKYHWLTEPDLDTAPVPALFLSDLQDANKKKILTVRFCLLITFCIIRNSLNEIKVFLTIFAWWWKDPDSDPDGFGSDPGGPKTYRSYWSWSTTLTLSDSLFTICGRKLCSHSTFSTLPLTP